MYDSCTQPFDSIALTKNGDDPALLHVGDRHRPLRIHRRHLAAIHRGADAPPIGPLLMRRIADARTLREAAAQLLRKGRKAAGPNRVRLDELELHELWSLCRLLARIIRVKTYRPGAVRRAKIPKEGKPGEFRRLTIQNAEDRLVAKATLLILEPLVDRVFSPFSFGFRPKRSRLSALATAIAFARLQNRWVWVTADVEKAFDRIPAAPFLDSCRKHFPADVVEFVSLIACRGKKRGHAQGSPISPFLANLYFDDRLDRPWHKRHWQDVLLRYADDLLLMYSDVDAAAKGHTELSRLAVSAGTPLKLEPNGNVHDLRHGGSVQLLGFTLSLEAGEVAIRIGEKSWDRLSAGLAKANLSDNAPLRARAIVEGWIEQMAPTYAFEDCAAVVRRLRETAEAQAFDEIPTESELRTIWSTAHARWHRLYSHEAALLPSRLHVLRHDYLSKGQTIQSQKGDPNEKQRVRSRASQSERDQDSGLQWK